MNPVEITQGKSFKGLSAYLLQDENRETSDRVGWTQTHNLNGADADQAWRLMLATANSANALKEASGIKKGKTPVKVVHHYSINFNPDDEVTPELMAQAVAESLAVYGMEHHQALAVEHTDKNHRHVHVMVNLIDPDNGMSAATPVMGDDGKKRSKLSNSQRRLSSWAQKFERENGLTITDGRLANANKRAQGEDVDAKRKPRHKYEQDKREKSADRRKDFQKRALDDRKLDIQIKSAALKVKCSSQWEALKASYRVEKEIIRSMMSPTMKEVSAQVKADHKDDWRTLFRKQQQERFIFDRDTNKVFRRLLNGAVTMREIVRVGRGFRALTGAFSLVQQRDMMMMRQDKERAALSNKVKAEIQRQIEQVKKDFDRQFTDARERFSSDYDNLKAEQKEAWDEIKSDWKTYNAERRQSFTKQRNAQQDQQRGQDMSRGRGMSPS